MSGGPVVQGEFVVGLIKGGLKDVVAARIVIPISRAKSLIETAATQDVPMCPGLAAPRVPHIAAPEIAYVRPYWCSEQRQFKNDELAICGDPELSRMDAQLRDVFTAQQQKLSPSRQEALKAEQRNWLREREACGANVPCLNRLYVARIRRLQDYQ
jgi:uncharacterized protein YecT (DUF1311 family)